MWFSVRCLFDMGDGLFEERVTLWDCSSFAAAVNRAEVEAREYAEGLGTYLGLAQAFALADDPRSGSEVFSLIRRSDLRPDEYLTEFFNTGSELQVDL
jgi:hypothetical protein